MLLAMTVGAQAAEAEEDGPAGPASADRAKVVKAAKSRSSHKRVAKRRGRRRGKTIGWAVPEKRLLAKPAPPPSGRLRIYSINYKDEADVSIYNADGSFNTDALAEVKHAFRCRRTGLEHDIDTRLIAILSHIYEHFGDKRIELLSGYRYQRRKTSNHYHGAAADIRIRGVNARKIRDFVATLDAGGVGLGWYPRIGFVHVDVRPPPSYRWIDYSRSNPHARDRLPPRGFKRKAPES